MTQPWVRAEIKGKVNETAARGAAYGQQVAPVLADPQRHHTDDPGEFKNSIHATDAPDDKDGMPRAWIISDVYYAVFLEFGTENMPEHATFAQIANYLGGDMKGARIDDQNRQETRKLIRWENRGMINVSEGRK